MVDSLQMSARPRGVFRYQFPEETPQDIGDSILEKTIYIFPTDSSDNPLPGSWYTLKTSDGVDLTLPFFMNLTPYSIVHTDLDGDGDQDFLIEYEEGYQEAAYSVAHQLVFSSFYLMDEKPTIPTDIEYWLEDQMPGVNRCTYKKERWGYFLMSAAIVQMFQDFERFFEEDASSLNRDMVQKTTDIITKKNATALLALTGQVGKEVEGKKYGEQCENFKPVLANYLDGIKEQFDLVREFAIITASRSGAKDGGVGIHYDASTLQEGYVVLLDLIPGGPAQKSGLKEGDKIVAVDGESLSAIAIKEDILRKWGTIPACSQESCSVQSSIMGPIGSVVALTIDRNGKKMEFKVPRDYNLMSLAFGGTVP